MTSYIAVLLHVISGRFVKTERGATAVEYGIMVALIAVVVIAAVALIGTNLNTVFGGAAGSI